jgi:hypothetical protein
MKTRLVLALVVVLVPLAGFAIWKLTKHASPTEKAAPGQVYDYLPSGRSKTGVPLRPMDNEIFEAIARNHFTVERVLDLFPDRPYHVKLVANLATQRASGVLIDLDRDQKWDERWELRTDGCTRYVLTPQKSNESPKFTLHEGHWIAF